MCQQEVRQVGTEGCGFIVKCAPSDSFKEQVGEGSRVSEGRKTVSCVTTVGGDDAE